MERIEDGLLLVDLETLMRITGYGRRRALKIAELAQAEKSARFITRAENQASKILAEIVKLKKLSNKKYYQYSDAQISELFGAIQSSLDEAKAQFTTDAPEKRKSFTFSA